KKKVGQGEWRWRGGCRKKKVCLLVGYDSFNEENMMDYIKRLKVCIRWFQDLEISYSLEQEKLKSSLELAQQKCTKIELLLKIKEEKLNSIIMEMRRNCTPLQEKLVKKESEKIVTTESLLKERETRLNFEMSQSTLQEDLARAQRELQSANQKV
ncbi:Kinesin-like protein KIN-14N, partial [Glycine soja]